MNRSLFNKIFLLIGALVLGQGLSFLAAPFLARYYTPEQFGNYGLVTSIIVLLSGFTTLKYDQALVVSEPGDRYELMCNILTLNTILTFLIALPLIILISSFMSLDMYVLIIGVFLYSNYLIFRSYNLSIDKIRFISKVDVVKSVALNSTQILSFMLFAYSEGLIFGYVASLLISVLIFSYLSNFKIAALKKDLLKKYKRFPKYTFPEYLVNTVSQQLPIYSLAIYYNRAEVGLYVFAEKIVRLPVQLISKSILQVLSRETVESREKDLLLRPTLVLLTVSTVCFLPLAIFSEPIINIYLGDSWQEVSPILTFLCFWMWIKFFNSPSSAYLIANGYQKFMLKIEMLSLFFRAVVLLYFPVIFSFHEIILLFSVVGVIINLVIIGFAFFQSYKNFVHAKNKFYKCMLRK